MLYAVIVYDPITLATIAKTRKIMPPNPIPRMIAIVLELNNEINPNPRASPSTNPIPPSTKPIRLVIQRTPTVLTPISSRLPFAI